MHQMRKLFLVASSFGLLLFARCTASLDRPKIATASMSHAKTSFYDLKAQTIEGKTYDFSTLKGKKVLIVNTASKCGFTPQYETLETLHKQYKDKNVVILGFPCNQFMGQEPAGAKEISAFCQKNYGVTFQLFDKIDVKGDHQSPIYAWLSTKSLNGWNEQAPTWNFCKYLINENGELVSFFPSKVEPLSTEITSKL
jgi:glutathione peroxidase